MFTTDENTAFTKKWPSLVAKFGKTKKSNFYRIESRCPQGSQLKDIRSLLSGILGGGVNLIISERNNTVQSNLS